MRYAALSFALCAAMPSAAAQVIDVQAVMDDPDVIASTMDGPHPYVFDTPHIEPAVDFETSASSSLRAQGRRTYGVENLDDALPGTAWVEGTRGAGVGERLRYRLVEDGGERVWLGAFSVVNGYGRSRAAWRENGRVRELLVRVNGRPLYRVTLVDAWGPQYATWPDQAIPLAVGDVVEFEIRSVYPGTRHADTALSELRMGGYAE